MVSMSRASTPTDNTVIEQFIRTFKEHKINDRTFQKELFYQIEINSKFRRSRKVFNEYVKSINFKPNKKSNFKSPEKHDIHSSTNSMLMIEPRYSKSFSEYYGTDFNWDLRNQSKTENIKVIGIFDEIAAKRAEIVDKIPFDLYEDNSTRNKILCLKWEYFLMKRKDKIILIHKRIL